MKMLVTDNVDEMRESYSPEAFDFTVRTGICAKCGDRLDSGNTTLIQLEESIIRCPICTPIKSCQFGARP